MKSDIFYAGFFQEFLVETPSGIGVIHGSGDWGREHIRIVGVLGVFLDQQINGLLWNHYFSDRVLCFWGGYFQFSVVYHHLLCPLPGGQYVQKWCDLQYLYQ